MLNSQDIKDPFRGDDWISPPPYIDYQMSSIIMHKILTPLRQTLLNDLQGMILSNKPSNWYITFLTTCILLHNYELSFAFQRSFSARRQAAVSRLPLFSSQRLMDQETIYRYASGPRLAFWS